MNQERPVILGYDAVSPLGADLESSWQRALRGESGIGPLTRFPLRRNFPVRIAGQVEEIGEAAFSFLHPRDMAQWTSPIFRHALLVVHRALGKSGLEITQDIAPRVAITFSSAIGGLDAVLSADRLLQAENKLPHPFTNPNSCINMVGGKISILTGATGPITSTITACATGATSLIIGALFLQQGMADVVICGAVDFPLVEPIVAGFATMNGAYRPKSGEGEEPPQRASRPFSLHRRGFVVAEGAACIVLATKAFAKAHGLPWSLEMAGWSMTADAFHFVAPNPETVQRCVEESIRSAGLYPADIQVVNAHGTSTKVGDKVEADVLRRVFGQTLPPISANKSQLGHAMGASSAIETVLALEGMLRNTVLPTINYLPDPDIPLESIADKATSVPQEFLLKNAFGFGGCNSCIVFQRTA
ncbi:3-oxoacyl-[acyl-carrier-protein] synthase II [Syntrophus gentianae]|uniref:3-oxoacyl-[acyl-carrier-protein] synthase II n=1 Tax=Syntrophus gentianae TaxID=43775 RepID=A0A1H7YG83_9BACT|nr:beta-ketoacyl-[acyl-carrier-protein] synthase family protein [Syntrophus gentianae]SEM44965.1 3-oxoacyl-[acyl-carrier-protein] synthase II [Syntrophus gentianae]